MASYGTFLSNLYIFPPFLIPVSCTPQLEAWLITDFFSQLPKTSKSSYPNFGSSRFACDITPSAIHIMLCVKLLQFVLGFCIVPPIVLRLIFSQN